MYVVLGASGNTGKVVASTLLGQKKAVRVVLHADGVAGQAWREKGAEVAIADIDDRAAVALALDSAEGAYVLLPPAFHSSQVRMDNDRRAKNIAAAITAAGVGHVVMLSSIGAQHPDGTGPVVYLHDAEATISGTLTAGNRSRAVTFLRAAYFMENWATALPGVAQGILPTFLQANRVIPMVATQDIGSVAARLLAEGGSGKRIIQLSGPRDYSPDGIADALGHAIGKPVITQQHPEEAMSPGLLAAGMNPEWARLFQELTHGINTGRVAWEGGHPIWRGETDASAALTALLGR